MKPRVVTLLDTLVFGLPALTFLVLWYVGAPLSGFFAFAGLAFGLAYGMILQGRRRFARSISFVTRHGTLVMAGKIPVPVQTIKQNVEDELDSLAVAWEGVGVPARAKLSGLVLALRPFPDVHYDPPKLHRLGLSEEPEAIAVGYRPDLKKTYLAHELGHVFLGTRREPELYAFTKNHGLPR